jgi:hypothetical protein
MAPIPHVFLLVLFVLAYYMNTNINRRRIIANYFLR